MNAIRPHGLRNVLKVLRANVGEGEVQLAGDLLENGRRHTDAARFRQTFKTRRHVDPVAKDVVTIDDDFAEIDADPELQASRAGGVGFR